MKSTPCFFWQSTEKPRSRIISANLCCRRNPQVLIIFFSLFRSSQRQPCYVCLTILVWRLFRTLSTANAVFWGYLQNPFDSFGRSKISHAIIKHIHLLVQTRATGRETILGQTNDHGQNLATCFRFDWLVRNGPTKQLNEEEDARATRVLLFADASSKPNFRFEPKTHAHFEFRCAFRKFQEHKSLNFLFNL